MKPRFLLAIIVAALALTFTSSGQEQPAPTPDLLFINANVVTMQQAKPKAEAIAIHGDRIVAVGSSAEITSLKGATTRVIDLKGKTVVPGMVDGHLHFAGLGAERGRSLDLTDTRSEAEAAAQVKRLATRLKPGEWITGNNWHTGNWEREAWPTKQSLDEAAPNNPVSLSGMHGHASWLNSAALAAAGVARETADPPGGKIQRDPAGAATGILIENAQDLVRRQLPDRSEPLEERIRKSVKLALSYGFTGAHDMGTSLDTIEAYKKLIAADDFPFRVFAIPRVWNAGPLFQQIVANGPLVDHGNHRLHVRAVKLSIDGALGSRGAALLAPYDDDPGNLGVIRVPYDQLYLIVEKSLRSGFTAALHAIGDRGNQMALDAVEQALKRVPVKDHRVRIEHAQVLRREDIPRFARLGILASVQWMHATLDMPWAEARVGRERIRTSYAWRTLVNAGVRLVGGSDEGAKTFSPFMGIHAAVTRQDAKGLPGGGWYANERLTREEALRSYTLDAAYAAFEEDLLGSIAPGKLADLAVLSRDIMTVPPAEILQTEALMTVVGGRIAYERKPGS